MFTPIVIESPQALQPVSRDPFIDWPEASPVTIQSRPADRRLATIVRAAADGDGAAMGRLVERFDRPLRSVIAFYRLQPCDADDVVQATWLAFLERGHTLRDPAAVSGWLMTTARRNCLRVLQARVRERLTADPALDEAAEDIDPHGACVAIERRNAVHGALAELPPRSRRLMTLLVGEPCLSYTQVGRALGIPVGSIGPRRLRSIARLRQTERLRALRAEA